MLNYQTDQGAPPCRGGGLAKEAGVIMTDAGAPYPYHKDPQDSVIRVAPTVPPMDELKVCCDVFVVCVKLATVEKILESRA